jgi:hypothetical protein
VAPERNREADESEIIHDTKSVSQYLAYDVGHIAAAVEHSSRFFDAITPDAECVSQTRECSAHDLA